MRGMVEVVDPAVQRLKLRKELKRARDTADLRQSDVAKAMEWSQSKVIRIENGDVRVSISDLKALLNFYGVSDHEKVSELLALARSSRTPSFYDQYNSLVMPGFRDYLGYEASASVIRHFDPLLVAGLLQTEQYARSVFAGMSNMPPHRANRLWKLRQQRQISVNRENPPEMLYVLDEGTLMRITGLKDSMLQ